MLCSVFDIILMVMAKRIRILHIDIEAFKMGAANCLIKSVKHLRGLVPSIHHILDQKRIREGHRQIEKTSDHSEIRYRKLYESLRDGCALVNMNGIIKECNETFQEMLGYDIEELKQLSNTDITPGKWHDYEIRIIKEQVLIRGFSEVYEKEYSRKDGKIFPVEIRTLLLKNELGENEGMWTIVRDITDRKRTEDRLIESEANFRELFEYSPIGKSMTRLDGSIHINKAFCEILGYSKEELQNKKWEEITFPDDIPESKKISQSLLEGKISNARFEKRYVHKNGSIIWTDISTYLRWDKEKKPKFFITTITDITEVKQAEEKLKKSEARFRSYFELPIAGIAITSPTAGWIEVNDHLCQILGYTREELLQKTWSELTHPGDLNLDLENFNRIIKGEIDGYSIDKRFIRKNGEIRWISLSVRCVRLADGRVDFLLALMLDITLRKVAEDQLRKNEEKYHNIFDNVQDVYFETLLDGTVLEVSPSIEIISNGQYKRADIIGKSMFDFYINIEERNTLISIINEHGVVIDFEVTLRNKDGSTIPCSISAKFWNDSQGNMSKIIGSMRDITARKRIEKEINDLNKELEERVMERTKELEVKNAELARMNRLFVGRELRMAELKQTIKQLEDKHKS